MRRDSPIPAEHVPRGSSATVVRLAASGRSDEEIVRAVRVGERWGAAALLDRYGPMVERIIRRIIGPDRISRTWCTMPSRARSPRWTRFATAMP
jgi:hypothetical protein